MMQLWSEIEVLEFPVFEVNDHFREKFKDSGKPLWVHYMETMRTIMSKESGLPLSELDMYKKLEFKEWVKAVKKGDKTIHLKKKE